MLADRGKVFKNDKFTGEYSIAGLNCNIDELSAAIGCIQIQKLPDIIESTNNIGEYIKRELEWKPKISIEEGVAMLLQNISNWKKAPVWTPDSISKLTKEWFKLLS